MVLYLDFFKDTKLHPKTKGPLICADYLFLERPYTTPVHYKKNLIKEKEIVSFSFFYLLAHFFEIIARKRRITIINEAEFKQILDDNKISFDYKYYLRYFMGQYLATQLLCKITSLPQKVVVICPYTIMGCILYLKERGVHIIEMQHGVINMNHFAYTGRYRTNQLFPDEICVFGEEEYKMFSSENIQYCKLIHKTGLYILEESSRHFAKDIFKDYRERFRHIIVFAGQVTTDCKFIPFIMEMASLNPEVLFVFIPRGIPSIRPIEETDNILYREGVNIYEYLKWCDIHSTVSSTTCLEAHYFKKPTIFYNLDKLAENYYKSILGEKEGAFYVDNVNAFQNALKIIENNAFVYKDFYARDGYVELSNLLE